MAESADILRLRTLLCFHNADSADCTVTNIARILGVEKYAVARAVAALEKEGYIDKSNPRKPYLTPYGKEKAKYYADRVELSVNHLMYEGVDTDSAMKDALHWALHNTDRSMEAIRAAEARYRVKYELRDKRQFSGPELCRKLNDGLYQYPFVIYRESALNGSNISMANFGFENPCSLYIQNGEGTVQLRAVNSTGKSASSGEEMVGRVQHLRYFDCGSFVKAESHGNLFTFPASALNFMNIGSNTGQILHGSVSLQVEVNCGTVHMPKSVAIFTIMI